MREKSSTRPRNYLFRSHNVRGRPNRSLSPTRTRAEFFVRREYSKGSMLNVRQILGDNTKNVSITAVQNGARGLAPNRYTVAIQIL